MLFFSTLLIGTLITISSYSWMGMWMGLEINLLSIIPLMNNKFNLFSSETSVKYFIVQALASTTLMFSIIFMSMNFSPWNSFMNLNLLMIFNSSLLMKMGAAPFHFWFPEVIEGLNWFNSFILLTWQKIAPMMLIITNSTLFMTIIIITSTMISGIMGMNQTSIRKILAYSSINHISWMIATLMFFKTLWLIYFTIYSIISMNLILIFNKFNIFYFKQIFNFIKSPLMKLFFTLNFFSLGGLPPFLGFFPKWLTIQFMINNNLMITAFFMILMTLLTLFFYIRITFTALTFKISNQKFKINENINLFYIWSSNFMTIFSLILITLMINLT
uniref:NADH-ubiquinone oxidoreductase chain 2 n=1 Tax=Sciodrepoides watsoni TaxID=651990 RepID=A0A0S2M890_9COLE|nr:NADH dehydrogenase subunit 2 [Sciodrepoides watsoni]ALO70910.1 NADH deshydrogenase subunit 2 [Sciodrepoides watsoni]